MSLTIVSGACTTEPDPAEVAAVVNSTPLNPDPFRSSIEAIDEGIFRRGTFDDARRKMLSSRLEALANELGARTNEPASKYFARDLRSLARMAGNLPANAAVKDSQLPNQWMRIRATVFADVWWFARSEADLPGAAR